MAFKVRSVRRKFMSQHCCASSDRVRSGRVSVCCAMISQAGCRTHTLAQHPASQGTRGGSSPPTAALPPRTSASARSCRLEECTPPHTAFDAVADACSLQARGCNRLHGHSLNSNVFSRKLALWTGPEQTWCTRPCVPSQPPAGGLGLCHGHGGGRGSAA